MKTNKLDIKLNEGQEDVLDNVDLPTLKRPNQKQKRVNVDFSIWIIDSLDKEAKRIGVTRQSFIKIWLTEKLEAH